MTPSGTPRSAAVVNLAKIGDTGALRDELTKLLDAAGWPAPAWHETTVADPGRGVAARAVADGAEVGFVCGGDGTGMSCAGALAGTGAAVAILPGGTGNPLPANRALPVDRRAAIGLATAGARRRIDVGAVDGTCFTVMAGMGFDAHLLDATPEA